LASKTSLQRHGVLLLDEINLRKSVAVCSKNLTYVGLTDFGDDGPKSVDINAGNTRSCADVLASCRCLYTTDCSIRFKKPRQRRRTRETGSKSHFLFGTMWCDDSRGNCRWCCNKYENVVAFGYQRDNGRYQNVVHSSHGRRTQNIRIFRYLSRLQEHPKPAV